MDERGIEPRTPPIPRWSLEPLMRREYYTPKPFARCVNLTLHIALRALSFHHQLLTVTTTTAMITASEEAVVLSNNIWL